MEAINIDMETINIERGEYLDETRELTHRVPNGGLANAFSVAADVFDRPGLADAVARWYALHGGAVHQQVQQRFGARIAGDVTHDVFVALLLGRPHVDPMRGSVRTLLMTMARHRAIDTVRRLEAERRRDNRYATDPTQLSGTELSARMDDDDTAARVRAALDLLTDETRAAIVLAYWGGHTYREVAVQLGIPEGTVKSRIRVGLRQLHVALGTPV